MGGNVNYRDSLMGPFTIERLKNLPASESRPLYAQLTVGGNGHRIIHIGRKWVTIMGPDRILPSDILRVWQ